MHVPTRFLKLFHQPIRVKILRVNTRKTSTSYAIGCYTTCRKRLSDWYFSVDISKQQLNVVQLNIVASLWFFSAQLPSHCIRSVYSLSVFCNVVHANTLVLMAHLVTFSESQWDQFHPRAKKPTAPWGSPWPPSAALPLDPAVYSAAHSSPCTFSLTPPAELRQNKQPKRSPHQYICYKSLHL